MRLAAAFGLLTVATLGLGACAGPSPAEHTAFCETADWYEYGLNDGRLGVPADKRDDFFAECQELGHAPDLEAYREGRAEGLEEYCTVENGYEAGRAGRGYHDVCPPEQELAFLQGYEEGRGERKSERYRYYPRFHIGFGHFGGHHYGRFGHHFGYHHW